MQRNYDLDFYAECIGLKRLPNESDDDLSDRLKKAFGLDKLLDSSPSSSLEVP